MVLLVPNILMILLTLFIGLNNSFDVTRIRKFPVNFKFGTATAAYQIEGGWNADGKGPSIWDTFTHSFPEKVADRTNADTAIDSYHLYKEDVDVLKRIGANFYRFSISWSRVLPTGEISSVNPAGIIYYHQLMDELIQNGIEPIPTIYHWDLPQTLQNLGGWTNPLIADYFVLFANLIFKEYGAKVKQWITFNEPKSFCRAYGDGGHAPGIFVSGVGDYLCTHHMLISHARTYHLYKKNYYPKFKGAVGITLNARYFFPNDLNNEADIEAADRALQFELGLFANPIFSVDGDYPAVVRETVDRNSANEGRESSRLPRFSREMVAYIKGTADFFGLNYYTSRIVQPVTKDNLPNPSKERDVGCDEFVDNNWPRGKSSWLYSIPEGLSNLLLWIHKFYGNIDILITENGWSDNGELVDDGRIAYLNDHFDAILNAIDAGVNVTGHATWTLIDNFEWISGFTEKFGAATVNKNDTTMTRILKKSAFYLEEVFKTKQITAKN